jgi:uncharacterized membrane protein YfcA
LGVGGGIVIVPVLFHVFRILGFEPGISMQVAVGTSLATIIPTAISSARSHARRGAVDRSVLRAWGPAIVAGAAAGTIFASSVKGLILTAIFGVFALFVAANLLFHREGQARWSGLPGTLGNQAIGFAIGAISAVMGIGGGTVSIPIMSACRFPIRQAVGTASALGLIIAVPGTIGMMLGGLGVAGRPPGCIGFVSLAGFALIAPTTILVAPLGARTAHAIKPMLLRYAFALFLSITGLRMLFAALA